MLKMNPIVKKDLRVAARSMKFSWGLFAYEMVLALIFLLAMSIIRAEVDSYYNSTNIYHMMVYLFPVLAVAQVCIVALVVPIITASSISGEKERQTFDIMLTTCMSPFSIVLGKVVSAVIRILFFVAASTPVMALAFVAGGLSWANLFYFLLSIILLSVFSGSIGILCSSFSRRSITAVILSFVIYFVIFVMTFLPVLVMAIAGTDSAGESLLPLLFNPAVFFEEFFSWIMTGESLFGEVAGYVFSPRDVGFFTYILAQGRIWMFTSAGCILLLSLLFMMLAAWKINPLHTSGGRRKKSKA